MKITRLLFLLTLFAFTGAIHAQTYTTTTVFSGLQMSVAFDIASDGRFFCTQKGDGGTPASPGTATIVVYNSAGVLIGTFYDLSDSVNSDFERGLLGITLDPDFDNNHYVYVYYNHRLAGDERIRIVRFTEVSNVGTSPTIIFDLDVSNSIAGNHVGGNLHFRPSDPTHIYFTIGDLAYQQGNPALNYADDLDKPYGKVLRISSSPLAPPPTDNPFYDDGNPLAGNCDWIWAYGFRNPFDFCFSPVNDSLYASENGWNTRDEVDQVYKGADYGWAYCEGQYIYSTTTACTTGVLPIETWTNPPALTGILHYSSQVMPEFDNHLLVADNDNGRIYDITLGNAPAYNTFVSRVQWQDMPWGITTMKQGTDGCVYIMRGGYTTNGNVTRICPQGLGTEDFGNPYFSLQQNAPNPFSTTTTLNYSMKQNAQATIVLYDIFGREVAVLANGMQSQGQHTLEINAQELGLAPGNYFCSMKCDNAVQSVTISVAE